MNHGRWLVIASALGLGTSPAPAQDAQVAVAASFTATAHALGAAFLAETGQEIAFSFGASGALYAQAVQGAPFDAFLSADATAPARLVADGLGVPDSLFTYAVGRLVLFSSSQDYVTGPESLTGAFSHIAIAEPDAAPYGLAAMQTLDALGLTESLQAKFVIGQNMAQAYQFVATGNAELGFVARSQVIGLEHGSYWLVDEALHAPIRQDAVLLNPDNSAAVAFLEFLRSEAGTAVIESYGYATAH